MFSTPLSVFSLVTLSDACVQGLEASSFGRFKVQVCTDPAQAQAHLAAHACDALLLDAGMAASAAALAEVGVMAPATLVVGHALDSDAVLAWLQRGAQDVLGFEELEAPSLPQRIRAAIERKRVERDARKSYATDLATGLPHQQQLIEHMSHLLALREREPSPMAVLVLRIEGLSNTQARLGLEAAHVLRRKIAVRLRAGVRASDVVAALGDASFAVLLGSLLTPADAERVGAKLLKALLDPFTVAGETLAVSVALGIGQYPQDGAQPDALLRRALGLAASVPAQGRAGLASVSDGGRVAQAANDD
ncbi:MAG: GGDEF domain-containing protein [Burkholderiales bacterium]|nr:GGDEF domain-containing protein [Burkholderiales bacterium]